MVMDDGVKAAGIPLVEDKPTDVEPCVRTVKNNLPTSWRD
jgi:hypothetical protein